MLGLRGGFGLGGVAAAMVLVASCATGGGASSTDDDGTTTTATTSTGGAGGAGGTGAGAMGGEGGGGGSPPACSEDPCKLTLPQCGCGIGDACVLGSNGRECAPEGDKTVGQGCADDCVAGHQCLSNQSLSAPPICMKFCETDEDCSGPGALCALELSGGEASVCSINCDPVSGAGCPDAADKCEIFKEQDGAMRNFTLCSGMGTGTQQSPCPNGTTDCADGYGCFNLVDPNDPNNTQQLCLRWCDTATGTSCPGGSQCANFQVPITVGTVTYGACVPTI